MSAVAKRRVCIVVLSRANYARIKTVIRAVHQHPDLELLLVVGGSALLWRYGDIRKTLARDGFKIDAEIYSIVEGGNPATMAKSTGMTIIELSTIFQNLCPDIVLTVADRFETLATAVAASYMNIPVAHTQGGEVTGSIDESVRHAVTKLAHLHFPATEQSLQRLLRMGEQPDSVFLTGCPSIDIVAEADTSMPRDIFTRYDASAARVLDPGKSFLLVLQHPVTTEYGEGRRQITQTLEAVKRIHLPTAWIWPNVDPGSDDIAKGLRLAQDACNGNPIYFFLNFTPEDFVTLNANCVCMIGNSSSAIREGAFLGTPVVNVGTRQNARERGRNVMDVGYDADGIEAAIHAQLAHGRYAPDHIYGDGRAAEKIVDILATVTVHIQKTIAY